MIGPITTEQEAARLYRIGESIESKAMSMPPGPTRSALLTKACDFYNRAAAVLETENAILRAAQRPTPPRGSLC